MVPIPDQYKTSLETDLKFEFHRFFLVNYLRLKVEDGEKPVPKSFIKRKIILILFFP